MSKSWLRHAVDRNQYNLTVFRSLPDPEAATKLALKLTNQYTKSCFFAKTLKTTIETTVALGAAHGQDWLTHVSRVPLKVWDLASEQSRFGQSITVQGSYNDLAAYDVNKAFWQWIRIGIASVLLLDPHVSWFPLWDVITSPFRSIMKGGKLQTFSLVETPKDIQNIFLQVLLASYPGKTLDEIIVENWDDKNLRTYIKDTFIDVGSEAVYRAQYHNMYLPWFKREIQEQYVDVASIIDTNDHYVVIYDKLCKAMQYGKYPKAKSGNSTPDEDAAAYETFLVWMDPIYPTFRQMWSLEDIPNCTVEEEHAIMDKFYELCVLRGESSTLLAQHHTCPCPMTEDDYVQVRGRVSVSVATSISTDISGVRTVNYETKTAPEYINGDTTTSLWDDVLRLQQQLN